MIYIYLSIFDLVWALLAEHEYADSFTRIFKKSMVVLSLRQLKLVYQNNSVTQDISNTLKPSGQIPETSIPENFPFNEIYNNPTWEKGR
jgi:hypothetical protein